jgi:hypothetical protein
MRILVNYSDMTAEFHCHPIAIMEMLSTCQREIIGLPCDGMTLEDDTLTDLCACLVKLQAMGYNVPQWVIDNVLDELEEEQDEVAE